MQQNTLNPVIPILFSNSGSGSQPADDRSDSSHNLKMELVSQPEQSQTLTNHSTTTRWNGYFVTPVAFLKNFIQSLAPHCVMEGKKLTWDPGPSIELKRPEQWQIKDITLNLTETFLPHGHYLRALRHLSQFFPEALTLLGLARFLPTGAAETSIKVADAVTLAKIGNHPDYPLDGNYLQTQDIFIKALTPIANRLHSFTGTYNGDCHTISDSNTCLFDKVDNGTVKNIRFKNTNITTVNNGESAAVIACLIKNNAHILSNTVENSVIETKGDTSNAAIGVARSDNGKVEQLTAKNCTITTKGRYSFAAVGAAAAVDNSNLQDITAINCEIKTTGANADTGIGAGYAKSSHLQNIVATDSRLISSGDHAEVGVGAGATKDGTLYKVHTLNSVVSSHGTEADAATGAGNAINSRLAHITAVNTTVTTKGEQSQAAIGAAYAYNSNIASTDAMNCSLSTQNKLAHAGIGAGRGMTNTVIKNTRVKGCRIETEGSRSDVGFGAGEAWGNVQVINTTVVNSGLQVKASDANTGIGAGRTLSSLDSEGSIACNTTINDQYITTDCDRIDLREMNTLLKPQAFETTEICPLNNSETTIHNITGTPIATPTQTPSRSITATKITAPESTATIATVEVASATTESTPTPFVSTSKAFAKTVTEPTETTPFTTVDTSFPLTGVLIGGAVGLAVIGGIALTCHCIKKSRQRDDSAANEQIEMNNLRPVLDQSAPPLPATNPGVRQNNLAFPDRSPQAGRILGGADFFPEKNQFDKGELSVQLPPIDRINNTTRRKNINDNLSMSTVNIDSKYVKKS